jgi:hypothetical protein
MVVWVHQQSLIALVRDLMSCDLGLDQQARMPAEWVGAKRIQLEEVFGVAIPLGTVALCASAWPDCSMFCAVVAYANEC